SGPRILQELNGDQHAPPTTSQVNTDQDDSTATTAQPTTHLNGPTTLQVNNGDKDDSTATTAQP
ncbi:hypothetical protein GN956_G27325, partial [Arapaima gigas]